MKTLILLLLMTGICLADEPEIIDYSGDDSGIHYGEGYFSENMDTGNRLIITQPASIPKMVFDHTDKSYKVVEIVDTTPNGGFDIDKSSAKVSCPDGYELTVKIINRNYDKDCENPYVICFHNQKFTDAELKCVKDQ